MTAHNQSEFSCDEIASINGKNQGIDNTFPTNEMSLQARVEELERKVKHLELAVRRQIRLGRMTE